MSWCPIPDDPWELEEYGIGTEDQLSKIWPYPIKKEVQWISRYLIYLSIYIYLYPMYEYTVTIRTNVTT